MESYAGGVLWARLCRVMAVLLGINRKTPRLLMCCRLGVAALTHPRAGMGRHDVEAERQGREFSSSRRAEAIDSQPRNRDVTGLLREGGCSFGEQPQGGVLDVAIGWPEFGKGGPHERRPHPMAEFDNRRQ